MPGRGSRAGWNHMFPHRIPHPCDCEILDATKLSMKPAAHDICYRIYMGGAWLDLMDEFWGNQNSILAPLITGINATETACDIGGSRPLICSGSSESTSSWGVGMVSLYWYSDGGCGIFKEPLREMFIPFG